MASLSILFGVESRAFIGEVQLDVSVAEEHVNAATITEHPVENGSIIADHIFLIPDELTLTGIITDTPVRILDGLRGAVAGEISALGGALAGEAVDGSTPSIAAFRALRRIHISREPVTVVTGLKTYTDMVMVEFRVPRSVDTGQALRFSARFRKITFVDTQTVTIPADILAAGDRALAQSGQDRGRQTPGTPGEETQARTGSIVSGWVGL